MARIASTTLVVALLAATVAAFVLTQGLKLEKSPIFGTMVVDDVFSPVCGCDKEAAKVSFKLRKADRIDVAIVDGDGVVRTILRDRSYPRGLVEIEWDGRDDAGRVLPEGEYQPRVHLDDERFTTTLPNPIRIDVTAPEVEIASIGPRVISPDGDGRADRVSVGFRSNEPVRGILFVNGKRRELKRFRAEEGTLGWNGKVRGRALRPGTYSVQVGAIDLAGNRAERTREVPVVLRYVSLGRTRIDVAAGAGFAVRVSADAERIRWTLGGKSGVAPPGTLRLRAPAQKGRFTLTVTA
ncbi:MAG: hypothetical protein M3R12_00495, partial [Actinomycetota bacterium]|nr:hypothetical protein [Actinomycetota bacterium]